MTEPELTRETIIRVLTGEPEYPFPDEDDLRVWWVPQLGMKGGFHVPVKSVSEGRLVLRVLAAYDLYQLMEHIKPDFCNAGGLEIFGDGGWCDWCCDDCFEDIDGCECKDEGLTR